MAPVEAVTEAAPEPAVEVPLQAFEVTEQAPVETTLEKIMEAEEPVIEPVLVEEVHIPIHPLEAPQQAHSEEEATETSAADNDQTPPTEENDENTTTD